MSNPHADASTTAAQNLGRRESVVDGGLLRRSWHAMSEMINPFSSSALASLPRYPQGLRERSTRADNIPEQGYGAVNLPPGVRVPKKLATPIKVEGKVWLACERTWMAYLNIALLLGAMSITLFSASEDVTSQMFSYIYGAISLGTAVYGYLLYQHRITMIRKRYAGDYDQVLGPLIIAAALFIAILSNFLIRVRQYVNTTT